MRPAPIQCAAKSKQSGEQCRHWATPGANVCHLHGSKAPQVRAKAAKRQAQAQATDELDRLGIEIDTSPTNAMLGMVREAAGNVAFLRMRVQQLDQGERLALGHDDEDTLAALAGSTADNAPPRRPSIAGLTGSVTKPNEAARHVLVSMYDDERERLMRWSKWCRDAGVDEARVTIEAEQGRQLGMVLQRTEQLFLGLALEMIESPQLLRTPELVRKFWGERAPGIVRNAIHEVTSTDGTER